MTTTGIRCCTKCRLDLPVIEFCKNARGPDGLNWRCKRCDYEAAVSWKARRSQLQEQWRHYEESQKKPCSKCGKLTDFENFPKSPQGRFGLFSQCKNCVSERARSYRFENREKVSNRFRAYYLENKLEFRKRDREWRERNPEKVKAAKARWANRALQKDPQILNRQNRQRRERLTDGYIRSLITQKSPISPGDIPQGLIETHRVFLLIKRELRNGKLK